jgi:hypothetical protein
MTQTLTDAQTYLKQVRNISWNTNWITNGEQGWKEIQNEIKKWNVYFILATWEGCPPCEALITEIVNPGDTSDWCESKEKPSWWKQMGGKISSFFQSNKVKTSCSFEQEIAVQKSFLMDIPWILIPNIKQNYSLLKKLNPEMSFPYFTLIHESEQNVKNLETSNFYIYMRSYLPFLNQKKSQDRDQDTNQKKK